MNRRHPFYILLLLLLALGVFCAGYAERAAAGTDAPAVKIVAGLEECFEAANGEMFGEACCDGIIEPAAFEHGCPAGVRHLSGENAIPPSLCPCGWRLPLRI